MGLGPVWAGSMGLGAGLGRPGASWAGPDRSGPVQAGWTGRGWPVGPGGLVRPESARGGRPGLDQAGAAGAVPPGHGRSGPDRVDSAGRVE